MSPDAPVPVFAVRRTEARAGGAANVCADLAALSASVEAVGLVGEDQAGAALRGELEGSGVGRRRSCGRPWPTHDGEAEPRRAGAAPAPAEDVPDRLRISSRRRVGRARCFGAAGRIWSRCLRATLDAVCIEDYNKGVCTDADMCQRVIASVPRRGRAGVRRSGPDLGLRASYAGATVMTPNRSEASNWRWAIRSCADRRAGGVRAGWRERLRERCSNLEAAVITLDQVTGRCLVRARAQMPEAGAHGGSCRCTT